jgi:hypothetical protein
MMMSLNGDFDFDYGLDFGLEARFCEAAFIKDEVGCSPFIQFNYIKYA